MSFLIVLNFSCLLAYIIIRTGILGLIRIECICILVNI